MTEIDRTIDGVAKTIAEVLEKKKYSIDYYQREYKWESKQIAELVADLTAKFLDLYQADHARKHVAKYPGYYLGSIIISQKGSQPFVVDGQQRLTSLTLVLTYLRRLQQGRDEVVNIDELIYSEKFGEKSFNLDVADRNDCMEALFEFGEYEPPADASESVHTLVARYSELDRLFPDELKEEALPFFIDWLKDRVQLVQITAYSDDDAYAIFETMNDRGLKLTPADMLKGYLLANMEDGKPRTKANDLWRKRLRNLDEQAEDASSDFLKTWLRSQYSTKIRERKKGARPEDWDRIGTEFHRWLRGANDSVGLKTQDDFYQFVVRDLDFYSHHYARILNASTGRSSRTVPCASSASTPISASPSRISCSSRLCVSRTTRPPSTGSWSSSAASPTSCSRAASGTSAPRRTPRCSTPCSTSCATSAVSVRMRSRRCSATTWSRSTRPSTTTASTSISRTGANSTRFSLASPTTSP